MDERSLKVLEFDKIKDIMKKYVNTGRAKSIIDSLVPYTNLYDVKEHLSETDEALRLILKKGSAPFEGAYDVVDAIDRAGKGASLMPGELLKIANILKCARRFVDYVKPSEENENYRVLTDITCGIIPLKNIESAIFSAIVGEDEIADKASTALYNVRRSLRDKNSSIKDKVNSLIRNNSKYLQENIFTIRGDRYVIPVKSEYRNMVPGLIHDESSTGSTLFIEPMSLVNLNNEIKELMLKEKKEIEKILSELTGMIYSSIISVKNDADIVYELDFIFAKAKFALEYECTIPNVNDRGYIDIIDGRHPLINKDIVVPISIYLGKEFTTLIITGPNTGGKTVTLKTLGLITIMAQSGMLIPAKENSIVSIFDDVFADIGDEQSIEQNLSTFSGHLTNIVRILKKISKRSLVLLDELGAGTDPTEGAALAYAILEYLRKNSVTVAATTHYSELKGYALKTENTTNASVEFDVETLRPTYKLLIGIPGKSNAFLISKRLGLSEDIIDTARLSVSEDTLHFEDLIQKLQEKTMKAENDARISEGYKLEAEKLKEKYELKLMNMQKGKENIISEANRKAKRIISSAKNEADEIIKKMKELEKENFTFENRQKIIEGNKKLSDSLDKLSEASFNLVKKQGEELKEVNIGENVFVPSLNQEAVVTSNMDGKGEVIVQAGIMKISVKVKDLRKSGNRSQQPSNKKVKTKREINMNMHTVSREIDLRGMDSEEACFSVDKYLDEAFMAGLYEVTIIHGKGTGILRQAINDLLKGHPHIKGFRPGRFNEGGSGVTIAQIQ